MIGAARFPQENGPLREILLALLLGSGGFALNMLELQLGWGMHFIFGNALIFAFLRTLRPGTLIAAASIASLRSILLWHHPWAWGIWTLEAVALALLTRKSSPIRVDVIFWLIVGTPLLALTYGGFMAMDRLSLLLVIAKQATNGVLNVALGEIIYATVLTLVSAKGSRRWPRMPIDAFVLMILMSIILIPTTVYLSMDAPDREASARNVVGRALNDHLQITGTTLGLWRQSRGLMLAAYAREMAGQSGSMRQPAISRLIVPAELLADFETIEALDAQGRRLWSISGGPAQSGIVVPRELRAVSSATLGYIGKPATPTTPQLALIVPLDAAGQGAIIAATLKPGTLAQIVRAVGGASIDGMFLVSPTSRVLTVASNSDYITGKVSNLPPDLHNAVTAEAVLVGRASYGNSLMSDLKDALMVRAMPVPGLPGWETIAVSRLSGEVLKAREGQLQLFLALSAFVVLVMILGSLLAGRIKLSLRNLAQSAADLAMTGAKRDQIDGLVISELSDISVNIATVGSQVSRERGALVSYQRRLRSIAKHAPVVVYAVDAAHDDQGALIYVSEAVEKILGYRQDEAAEPGWWSRTVHPDDRDACQSIFQNLKPGEAANLEYRLRHKLGHYVWIYDNLAVEADPFFGGSEAVGLLMDISDRKLATAQLLQADKMASLGRMVSGVAHELNQPLNFIKMAAMNLREHVVRGRIDPARFTTKLESVLSHVNRASAIILQMRVFGRTPTETPHPMAVAEAVDAVLTMVGPQLDAAGITIDTTECARDVTVRALPVLLEQVLLNLLINAQDAIHSRQADEARHDAADDGKGAGWIKIAIRRHNGQAIITVDDNGTGLPDALIPQLFEPFFTTKPPKSGTGLGLSISYGIIRDLDGHLHAENGERGARFIIELPLSEQPAQS